MTKQKYFIDSLESKILNLILKFLGLVEMYDFFVHNQEYYIIVMEKAQNFVCLTNYVKQQGVLPEITAKRIFLKVS